MDRRTGVAGGALGGGKAPIRRAAGAASRDRQRPRCPNARWVPLLYSRVAPSAVAMAHDATRCSELGAQESKRAKCERPGRVQQHHVLLWQHWRPDAWRSSSMQRIGQGGPRRADAPAAQKNHHHTASGHRGYSGEPGLSRADCCVDAPWPWPGDWCCRLCARCHLQPAVRVVQQTRSQTSQRAGFGSTGSPTQTRHKSTQQVHGPCRSLLWPPVEAMAPFGCCTDCQCLRLQRLHAPVVGSPAVVQR